MVIKSNVIHVVMCQWDLSSNYAVHASPTILSAIKNCSLPIVFHILYNKPLSEKNFESYSDIIRKYGEIVGDYECEIKYHDVIIPEWVLRENRLKIQQITPAALFRLYIHDILVGIDRAIYLDCDLIVNVDLAIFEQINLDGYYLAACLDPGAKNLFHAHPGVHEKLGICHELYFNSGFLVLNLNMIRLANVLPDTGLEFLRNHPELPCLDQEILNYLFQKNVYHLDGKYNLPAYMNSNDGLYLRFDESNYNDCIIHYYGFSKPWNIYGGFIDFQYWHYFIQTPWGSNKNEVMSHLKVAFPRNREDVLFNYVPNLIIISGWGYVLSYIRSVLSNFLLKLIPHYISMMVRCLKL